MWLSYIIPLYNCEKYIEQCLESLLAQGLKEKDYEIIVVNDGSTDSGADIVGGYVLSHPNILLINQKNKGVSEARNRGMEMARGDYIIFVDADDYLIGNGLELLKSQYYDKGDSPDFIFVFSRTVDRYYNRMKYENLGNSKLIYEGDVKGYVEKYGFRWNVWGCLIKRTYLVESGIKFKKFPHTEDVMFMLDLFCEKNGSVLSTSLNIYRYRLREGSANTRYDYEFLRRTIIGVGEILDNIRNHSIRSDLSQNAFDERIYCCQRVAFTRICSSWPHKIGTLIKIADQRNIFPIINADSKEKKILNFITSHPRLFYLICLPYRIIFLPFIKPYLQRN
ncbi:MAG: glycosyltransferase [Paramuribaculum sp.]|nr:glycosyltransferase [Paramuribaculum sp.]